MSRPGNEGDLAVGLLGGTFDPIHRGHVHIARRITELFRLDQVWFLVARTPPHKRERELSDSYHRYTMTALALQPYSEFLASALELHREGPSYTVDTLREVESRWSGYRFGFIAGSDSLRDIRSWKDYATLFEQQSLIFVQRPGARVELEQLELPEATKRAFRAGNQDRGYRLQPGHAYLVDVDAPPVSSTDIRKALATGQLPPSESLSADVFTYAKKYRLYDED